MASEPGQALPPVRIEQVVYPGKSLAHHQGKVLFTDEGLPGELIEVRLVKDRTGHIDARTVRVLEPAAARRPPRCAHYRVCSPYQIMDEPLQLKIKRTQVEDILGRQFGIETGTITIKASPQAWGYRNRVRLHCLGAPGSLSLAYHQPGTVRTWAPVQSCELISKGMNRLLSAALDALNEAATAAVEEIEVKETATGRESLLILSGRGLAASALPPDLGLKLARRFPLTGLVALGETRRGVAEKILFGREYIENEAGGLIYRVGPRSFFQVNRFLLDAVLDEVRTVGHAAGPGRVADLYCGVGTFGLALAAGADGAEGVESDPANTAYLAHNLRLNAVSNFVIRRGTAEEWVGRILSRKPGLVMVDPPRRGLGPQITGPLLKAPPPTILYLSCDPATLGRDLKALRSRYALRRLTLYDFFPQTPHIETLSVLDRR